MTIKQSTALVAVMGAITLAGAGCLSRPAATPARPTTTIQVEPQADEPDAAPVSDTDLSDWVRYDKDMAGQIGMSFLYPPELTPVKWDTEAWGEDAVGVDFGGFGIARIPNPERLTASGWLVRAYPDFSFDRFPVDREHAFAPAVTDGACEAVEVMDDFDEGDGLSGIGGTVFVNVGDASLYAFSLGQDWNQELGDRTEVIRTAMETVEWFAERTGCPPSVTVRDDRTGVSFAVPSALAPVLTEDEYGWGTEEDEDTSPFTCLAQRMYFSESDDASTIFLAIKDTWECETLGRGGYWGDQARQFVTEEAVAAWCDGKDSCETFANPNGVTVWHASSERVEDWGDTLEGIHEYAVFNPNRSIHGILFSNQGFVRDGLGPMTDELAAIVDSLAFVD